MVKNSPFSSDLLQKAEIYLQKKIYDGEIVFSGATYQIEVKEEDTGQFFWPFLQLDIHGHVKDHFCSCSTGQQTGCLHEAIAWLRIFNGHRLPLHVRFQNSFWNQIGLLCMKRHGSTTSYLEKKKNGAVEAISSQGKILLRLLPKEEQTEKWLDSLLFKREVETEENSLKFSNLSVEELAEWRQGRPKPELAYELSFWSDLAKWWMLQEEKNVAYHVEVDSWETALPRKICLSFPNFSTYVYIGEAQWPYLLPFFSTIKSNVPLLTSLNVQKQSLYYIEEKKILFSEEKAHVTQQIPDTALSLEGWFFVPKEGFYKKPSQDLEAPIQEESIAHFLDQHAVDVIIYEKKTAAPLKIHASPVAFKTTLLWTENQELCFSRYLFTPGDLQAPFSTVFHNWAYIEKEGFFKLEMGWFQGKEYRIKKEKVGPFISKHRHVFQNHPGYQVHLSLLEKSLSYTLDPKKGLTISDQQQIKEVEQIDLGEWVYIKDRGFYSKITNPSHAFLMSGRDIPLEEVSRFIEKFKQELEQIPGFFSPGPLIEKAGLHIILNAKKQITVKPVYHCPADIDPRKIIFFDKYVFLEGKGFFPLLPSLKIPAAYQQETTITDAAESYFLLQEIEQLKPWILSIDQALKKPEKIQLQIDFLRKTEKGEWLVEAHYKTDLGTVPLEQLYKALKSGNKYYFSPMGFLQMADGRWRWIKNLIPSQWEKKNNQLKLDTMEWARLFATEDILPPQEEESLQLFQEFSKLESSTPFSLEKFQSSLRSYQEIGVNWLWFLYSNKLSGLLCDEMGLGKTHQGMGLICAIQSLETGAKFLVVCPTSVIYHWEALLKKFLPSIRVKIFYGADRNLEGFMEEHDLLLTSYGILRTGKKSFSHLHFSLVLIDEIQHAKNPHSQTHKALKSLQATTRIGLTGTPIENRLSELKALLDLVLPGYMPPEAQFRNDYVLPIEKEGDKSKKNQLSLLIKPFILRRKKSEVLLELPTKMEEMAYTNLSDEQKNLYKQVYFAQHAQLLAEIQKEGSSGAVYLHVFTLMSQLKQICNHPALFFGDVQGYKKYQSGKWDLFTELLQEALDSGQKVVIFSQYLKMLDIIQLHLKEEQIAFVSLRGSTRDRRTPVIEFQTNPSCHVFVGSLQAAGVGIDLTAGSVVIHYDRWWNPAKENQATDRVHRIGQSRGVQVFKLITKETIEEQIHTMIEKKLSLLDEVVGFDDHQTLKKLSKEELLQLLQMMKIQENL